MQKVTVSSDLAVVIPPELCESLHIRPGQEMEIRENNGHIELVTVPSIRRLRGFLKGIDPRLDRGEDRY